MKMSAINKIFTDKVAKYLAKGYIIHVSSMAGSQGEIGRIDLVKDEELIRVWLNKEHSYDHHSWRGDFITLQVSRWNYPASSSDDRGYTVWNSDLQTIEESKYYKIADNWYVEDLEEAIKAHKVRSSRFEYRCSLRDPNCSFIVLDSEKAREIGRKFLTRSIGYKRISNKEIIVKKYEGHSFYKYAISYKGHEYRIYA